MACSHVLLACPFCGGAARFVDRGADQGTGVACTGVECTSCSVRFPGVSYFAAVDVAREFVAAQWNQRSTARPLAVGRIKHASGRLTTH
ncbi:Lar family restriction alleviation protein [Lichenibacterium dinghuense]|uniref:Lar family restriction alleviation protein n=1 Tax=Lichenibacterium dinghuense TaxID=2895977 RepID=UPI003D1661F9